MRIQSVLVDVLNASCDFDCRISRISALRRAGGLRELKFDFSSEQSDVVAPGLAWVYRRLSEKLLAGEAVLTGGEERALVLGEDGVPSAVCRTTADVEHANLLGRHQLMLVLRSDEHLDPDAIGRALLDQTWMGSPIAAACGRAHVVELLVGAGRHLIRPKSFSLVGNIEAGSRLYHAYRSGLHQESVAVRRFSAGEKPALVRIPANKLADALGVDDALQYGLRLKTDISFDVWTEGDLDVETFVSDVHAQPLKASLRSALVADVARQREVTVSDLEARAREIQRRPTVKFSVPGTGILSCLVPTNEMETVLLAGRLEKRIAQEFSGQFNIVSYTGRKGIDCFCQIKKNAWQNTAIIPVEFEFSLENFFRHEHPLEQCELIICWSSRAITDGRHSFGREGIGSGALEFEITSHGWKRIIRYRQHQIQVLPLENLVERS